MSPFQSHLNAERQNIIVSLHGQFPVRTPKAGRVLAALGRHGFAIGEPVEREHHIWIPLECGAVVSVYVTGTVLVQGRIRGFGAAEVEQKLRAILRPPLVWQAKVDK